MRRRQSGALLIPQEHLEKHRRRFRHFEPLNAQVLFSLRAVAQRVNDDLTERFSEIGLTARQYNYLSVIYVEDGVTTHDIVRLIHTASPTVTSMINSLERDGLIVRKQNPLDARSSVIRLTPRGRELYQKAFHLHHRQLEEKMVALTPAERGQLVNLLTRLGEAFAPTD